jgi:carbamate kinase
MTFEPGSMAPKVEAVAGGHRIAAKFTISGVEYSLVFKKPLADD